MMKIYAKVTAGPLHKIFTKFFADMTKARKAWQDWGKQYGVEAVQGHCCRFSGPPPKGWKKSRKQPDAYTPDMRTKEGAKAHGEMLKLPVIPGATMLVMQYLAVKGKDIMQINSTGCPTLKSLNKTAFLTAIDDYWLPKDRAGIKEITASEYAKLWEKGKRA
jgi:hypothetical protein